ncbi:MAG: hypothetical protein FJ086_09255, partial [Deltaproteobacteria bacterium]|nr:hypothetical protein [Deltaproteobacteria bacterium]
MRLARGCACVALLAAWPGMAWAHAGLPEALAHLDRELARAPSPGPWLSRAERQLQDGQWAPALEDLARARGHDMDVAARARYGALKGQALEAAGRPGEAL